MSSYTTKKTSSWFERLGKSFIGIVVGLVLLVGATALLWWNEGNFVKTQAALNEAQSVTQELGDISKVDGSLDGRLVHASGLAETEDVLEDPLFGVSINAIRLERSAEYYQWVENKETEKRQKLGGGEEEMTTYTYAKKWVRTQEDSDSFADPRARMEHHNTVIYPLENFFTVQSQNVTFGAYHLPKFLIDEIRNSEPLSLELSEETTLKLNERLSESQPDSAESQRVHTEGNTVYLGLSPISPNIGDVRVTFKQALPCTVSLIAKLNGNTFENYVAKNGKTVGLLSVGTHSAENMYESAHAANVLLVWILRVVGIILVCISLCLIAAPLSVFASVVPFLGKLVGAGTGMVCVLLGLAWSLLVIALAWLFYRPLIGIVLLVAAVALVLLLYKRGRSTVETFAGK